MERGDNNGSTENTHTVDPGSVLVPERWVRSNPAAVLCCAHNHTAWWTCLRAPRLVGGLSLVSSPRRVLSQMPQLSAAMAHYGLCTALRSALEHTRSGDCVAVEPATNPHHRYCTALLLRRHTTFQPQPHAMSSRFPSCCTALTWTTP